MANVQLDPQLFAQFQAFQAWQAKQPKRRGRPPKQQVMAPQEQPKRRGRPPKAPQAQNVQMVAQVRRGRPPKQQQQEAAPPSVLDQARAQLPPLDENASRIYNGASKLAIGSLFNLVAHLDVTARSMIAGNSPNLEVGKRVKIIGVPPGKTQFLGKRGRVTQLGGKDTVIQLEENGNQLSVPTVFLELVRGRAPGQAAPPSGNGGAQQPKRRGRPPGSKNKPKDAAPQQSAPQGEMIAQTVAPQQQPAPPPAPQPQTSGTIRNILDDTDPERAAIQAEGNGNNNK